jgi:phosphoglycolate phosphatase-like HAD superfamily hydrolase
MTTKHVIFDLDGVVIDSRDVIVEAYRRAGVAVPNDILTTPGYLELNGFSGIQAAHVRVEKDEAYLQLLEIVPMLPGFHAAQLLHQSGVKPSILTGAPHESIDVLARRCGVGWPFAWGVGKLASSHKRNILSLVGPAIYIDDQPFDPPHNVTFIRYRDQSAIELFEEVSSCVFV